MGKDVKTVKTELGDNFDIWLELVLKVGNE